MHTRTPTRDGELNGLFKTNCTDYWLGIKINSTLPALDDMSRYDRVIHFL